MAVSFAREGCTQIAILDLNEVGLAETARACLDARPGATVLREVYDAREEDEVERAVDAVRRGFGRIDYAVNCAGSFNRQLILLLPPFGSWSEDKIK